MKIYKFRKLVDLIDACRLKKIIETGEFKCSNFWGLNDPMEGVFSIVDFDKVSEKISEIYGEKGKYKICAFSGEKGFKYLPMWGYYAGGFKGVAIEVDAEYSEIKKVNYCDNSILLNDDDYCEHAVEKILSTKNTAWNREEEYRFLDKLKNDFKKIGNITAIYFGTPYDNLENSKQIQKDRKIFFKYKIFKEEIIKIAKKKDIKCFDVEVKNGEVKKKTKNLWS
ncbi:hypothetical protein L6307_05160 [Candidatus Parcubacteria bacterium]|nr:hypothetical protein [Candidatus Parcubacteria bacterium]MCG2700083.1 hypothetical protein [Candidatus Parcubacteria bacterium]